MIVPGSIYSLGGALDAILGRGVDRDSIDAALARADDAADDELNFAVWAWMTGSADVVTALDEVIEHAVERLKSSAGRERHRMLAAIHGVFSVSGLLAAILDVLGPDFPARNLTRSEVLTLVVPEDGVGLTSTEHAAGVAQARVAAVRTLFDTQIDLPWVGCDFSTNLLVRIQPEYERFVAVLVAFVRNFKVWTKWRQDRNDQRNSFAQDVVSRAVDNYRRRYPRLANSVPEFKIWAGGESTEASSLADRVALDRLRHWLARADFGASIRADETRRSLRNINCGILEKPLVSSEELKSLAGVEFPLVLNGYVDPSYRWSVIDDRSMPADETWWSGQRLGADLGAFLAAYVASPQGVERPLVVLGHPGSGKSLFTKVCAARLSENDAYVVARVALRDVPDPDAAVFEQIDAALRRRSHGRITWQAFCDAGRDRTRVLFIDGLDELMQATGATESGYLRRVAEFQQRELDAAGPIFVIVTSRTVVADLAKIPLGCVTMKFLDFTEDQARFWLDRWTRANLGLIEAGKILPVPVEEIVEYGQLSRQPLLLLLLAVFAAKNEVPRSSSGTSSAELYEDLLREFIDREAAKGEPDSMDVADERWRLGIAAFGMFNRGRHYISEKQLIKDLEALEDVQEDEDIRRLGPARRVIGRFFFVVSAETAEEEAYRSYEFLHATFGEYLIAYFVVRELADLSESRPRLRASLDDHLLFALLSHQSVSVGGAAILPFVAQRVRLEGSEKVDQVTAIARTILRESRQRWERGRFSRYLSRDASYVECFANYTANIVQVLLWMTAGPVEIAGMTPSGMSPLAWWRELLQVWRAGLRRSAWEAMMESITVTGDGPGLVVELRGGGQVHPEIHHEWLMAGDQESAYLAAVGWAALHNAEPAVHDLRLQLAAGFTRGLLHDVRLPQQLLTLTVQRLNELAGASCIVVELALAYGIRYPEAFQYGHLRIMVRMLVECGAEIPELLAVVVAVHPQLLIDLHEHRGVLHRAMSAYPGPPLMALTLWSHRDVNEIKTWQAGAAPRLPNSELDRLAPDLSRMSSATIRRLLPTLARPPR
ncbi:hypothetical protein AB0M02_21005 [Actinoplanes sp. NPDC051861]|uniref:NACHT domain-containing protein n=1 Tax=Actinoplanes sp. NPDC051861 TaxID=3155170 RepID=UPI00344A198B